MNTIVNINRDRLFALQESILKLSNEFDCFIKNANRIVKCIDNVYDKFNNITKDKTNNTIPIKFINLYLLDESIHELLCEIKNQRIMNFDVIRTLVTIVCKRYTNLQY